MLEASPSMLYHYARYAGHPAQTGPLSARMVELIYIALDASSTHLFESGLTTHMKRALEVGATQADIFSVLHLLVVQGLPSVGLATDILAELTGEAEQQPIDEIRQARIEKISHLYALSLCALNRLDPAYVDVMLDFIEHGQPNNGLSPAECSIVQTALHACFTAFNPNTLRQIITTALAQDVTPAQLRQAIQLAGHLAVHGTALGTNVYKAVHASVDKANKL